MINVFCVRTRGSNIGNDAIFLGLRHLLRSAFATPVNLIAVPASGPGGGLSARNVHEINLLADGVVVGGGNFYENGGLAVDVHALDALRPPMMLVGLSHGRIHDQRHRLVPRTDSMPAAHVVALNRRAAVSVARDEATLAYLDGLGVKDVLLGGCPSQLLSQVPLPIAGVPTHRSGILLSLRSPELTTLPIRDQARLRDTVARLIEMLAASGQGPVRLLCHDVRDLPFAASFDGVDCVVPDDVHAFLAMLRGAALVVTFRLHAFVPCMSFGTPAINLGYDERSSSLVRTLGFAPWNVDFVGERDVVEQVRDRSRRLDDLAALREQSAPRWQTLEGAMRSAAARFADLVGEYAGAQTART